VQSRSLHYMPALDHLRFVAAGLVVLFHTVLETRNTGRAADRFHLIFIDEGHIGVTLFMVISGFIMMTMFAGREMEPLKFYLNRVLRIYPLMVLVVTLGYFATPDPRPTSVGIDYLMSLLPISNLYRLQYGAFGGHFWTIAVELQFYLLLPLLLKFRQRHGTAFYATVLGIAFLCRAAQCSVYGTAHTFTYFSMFGSIDLFIAGMIAAEIFAVLEERKVRFSLSWTLVAVIATWAILRIMFSFPSFFHVDYNHMSTDGISHSNKWVFWPLVQAIMWSSLLLIYLRSKTEIVGSAWLANFGRWSYSTYIWHISIIAVLKHKLLWMSPYMFGLFVVWPATLLVSFASYHLLEMPFLGLRSAYAKQETAPSVSGR
jgi:peptidoglycan/LPS O-acetylase OafA/YrhL